MAHHTISRRMISTSVASVAALALLVPALHAGSPDAEPTHGRGHAGQAEGLRTLAVRAGSPLPATTPVVPPADDKAAIVDGLKGDDYVVAQAGVIEEAPAPAEVAEAEPTQTAEPAPTQTAEPAPEPTQTPDPEPAPTQTAAPEPAPTQAQTQESSGGAHTSPDGQYTYEHSISTWERLAQCESGGNWSINTGNGYYGGIQFSKSSWDAVGGSGYPHENSKWEQIHRGELLHDRQGWGAWPACSRKLGLR